MAYSIRRGGPDGTEVLAALVVVVLVLGLMVGWAQVIHHDWRCAFTSCRIVTS